MFHDRYGFSIMEKKREVKVREEMKIFFAGSEVIIENQRTQKKVSGSV